MPFSCSSSLPEYRIEEPDGTVHEEYSAEDAYSRYHEIREIHRTGSIRIWDIKDFSYESERLKTREHTEEVISLRTLRYRVDAIKAQRRQLDKEFGVKELPIVVLS